MPPPSRASLPHDEPAILEMRRPGSKLANLVRLTADEAYRMGAKAAD